MSGSEFITGFGKGVEFVRLPGGVEVGSVDSDPSAGAGVAATLGTIAIRSDVAQTWQKTSSPATGWEELGGGGGSGDVVGPAVATDTALALFDTTSGKLLSDSAVLIANVIQEGDSRLTDSRASVSNIVAVPEIGSATYDTVEDFINNTMASGFVDGLIVTDNGDDTVACSAGKGYIRATDSHISQLLAFDVAATASIAVTAEVRSYIYVDYNGGTPIIAATTDLSSLDHNTNFVISLVFRNGSHIHISGAGQALDAFIHRSYMYSWEAVGIQRASGLVISEDASEDLALNMTAGVLYQALERIPHAAIDTSTDGANDEFSAYYRDGASGWTEVTAQHTIDNLQYDPGTGALATLTANRYAVHWLYMMIDGDIHTVYGQGDYVEAQALAVAAPGDVPAEIGGAGILIAKVIVQKSATDFHEILLPWSSEILSSSATDHGGLAGLGDDDHTQYQLVSAFSEDRIPFGSAAGPLEDSADLTWDGTSLGLAAGSSIAGAGALSISTAAGDLTLSPTGNVNVGTNTLTGTRGWKVDLSGDGGDYVWSQYDNQVAIVTGVAGTAMLFFNTGIASFRNIYPYWTSVVDLGTPAFQWQDIYLDGKVTGTRGWMADFAGDSVVGTSGEHIYSASDGNLDYESGVIHNFSCGGNTTLTVRDSTITAYYRTMLRDNVPLVFGSVTGDSQFEHSPVQTVDSLCLWLSKVNNSNALIIAEFEDDAYDFGHAAQLDPTLWFQSRNQSTTEWGSISRDPNDFIIGVGAGGNGDLFLNPAGVVKFGTHSALAAETVTGFMLIKDSGGTSRKVAIVS